eukprot:8156989-Lingulodinium_polyedra.AAC.1
MASTSSGASVARPLRRGMLSLLSMLSTLPTLSVISKKSTLQAINAGRRCFGKQLKPAISTPR